MHRRRLVLIGVTVLAGVIIGGVTVTGSPFLGPTGMQGSDPCAPTAGSTTDAETGDDETTGASETPTTSTAAGDGFVFLGSSQLSSAASKAETGEEPWNGAYDEVISRADQALNADPRSVTDNGGGNYWKSDNSDRHDYLAAIDMGDWIRDLGLAYQLTGEDRYAEKATELIHHWFIDEETKMQPTVDNKVNPWSIEIYITVPKMIYGASMVRGHSSWEDTVGDDAMNDWVRQFLDSAETHEGWASHNNIYAWAVQTRAVSAAYLGDQESLESAFDDWKTTAIDQVDADGKLQHELGRGSRNLFYSLYGLKALTLTAEIARHHGTDLYGYDDGDGVVLRRAFDYHAPYARNPGSWLHHSSPDLSATARESNIATYELAYSVYEDQEYLDTVQSAGRPVYDQRILGVTTLTHGNLFDLSTTR